MRRFWLLLGTLSLCGCETLGYYVQSAQGQLQLLSGARDIQRLLADPTVAPGLKHKLRRVVAMRRFAVQQLALPDNDSYGAYANVGREALVWSLVAAPRLGLQARQWCYPVIGCASYRGYFARADAQAEADRLRAAGWDVAVEAVPAYSTLGWFDDPLPSTVIDWPEAQLAGLIFHELAHQRLYANDDSPFNESYAMVVEREGVRRWLQRDAEDPGVAAPALRRWRRAQQRATEFDSLLQTTRQQLQAIYDSDRPEPEKLQAKADTFAGLQTDYQTLRHRWGGYPGYDGWMRRDLNNAHLASQQTYSRWVPALQQLLANLNGDLAAFHAECARQARRSTEQRLAWLVSLASDAAATRQARR